MMTMMLLMLKMTLKWNKYKLNNNNNNNKLYSLLKIWNFYDYYYKQIHKYIYIHTHILFDFSFGDLFTWDQDFMKQKKKNYYNNGFNIKITKKNMLRICIYVCMHKVALIYFFPELISVNQFNIMKIVKK